MVARAQASSVQVENKLPNPGARWDPESAGHKAALDRLCFLS
jgi:hypothetical protein